MADRKPQQTSAIVIPTASTLLKDLFVAVVAGLVVAMVMERRKRKR